ncbi:MAG TPA: c-type cytochrome [Pirellulales bacterium]|nr:c-type cytochrome [Pirellulales bacterium]
MKFRMVGWILLSISIPIFISVGVSTARQGFSVSGFRLHQQIEEGHQIFQNRCAGCHVVDTDDRRQLKGPSLEKIGEIAASRRPPMAALSYILESVVKPDAYIVPGYSNEMPQSAAGGITKEQLRSLIAFLGSRGADVDVKTLTSLDMPDPLREKPPAGLIRLSKLENGLTLFDGKAKCATCHGLIKDDNNELNLIAPNLSDAGDVPREQLIQKLRDPTKHLVRGYETSVILLADGRSKVGRILRKDSKRLWLATIASDGHVQVEMVPMEAIEPDSEKPSIIQQSQSIMPNYSSFLSTEEIEAIAEFLSALHST